MIFCLTYFTLTFLLPARSTYYLLKEEEQEKGAAALWSVYWPIYFIILLLKNFIPFLGLYPCSNIQQNILNRPASIFHLALS